MIGNYFARLTGSKRNLLALLASSVVFTAGCANMSTTAPTGANPFSSPATLSGNIHGGNQPVTGATVTLWYAGQNGTPAFNPTLAATTTSDGNGAFSFVKDPTNGNTDTGNEYSCPTGTDPLVYVMSKGGNTQNNGVSGQTNTAAAFMAIYGTCYELTASNFVYMSEVTTTATMAAIVQFFNPATEVINADGTGQQKVIMDGINNTVALMADLSTGLAKSPSTFNTATNAQHITNINSSVTTTATPETSKLNLIANIISACINGATSSASGCTTLFSAAVPPPASNVTNFNGAFPATTTDTLQALYYMFTNPTSSNTTGGSGSLTNIATLFGLAGGIGAPYQPSLASAPTDWTLGITYTASGACGTPTGGTGAFISSPKDIAIDAFNNVWFANSTTGGNLSEIAQGGAPATCVNLDAGSANGLVIDTQQNIWVGAGTTMYRYSPGSYNNGVGLPAGTLPFPAGTAPLALAADGVNNVYFSGVSGTTGSLYQLIGAANSAVVTPTLISNTVGTSPLRLMPDFVANATQGNIWATSGAAFVSQVAPSTAVGNIGGFVTNMFSTSGSSYGVTVSNGRNVFVSAMDTNAITQLAFSGGTYSTPTGWPYTATSAGISNPTEIAIDGRLNTWIPNHGNGAGTGSVSEISSAPNPLSPSTGFVKSSTYLNSGRALVVDQAGNIWIVGDGNNFVTEIVGAAVPIYQPYAVGLRNNRFQTIP